MRNGAYTLFRIFFPSTVVCTTADLSALLPVLFCSLCRFPFIRQESTGVFSEELLYKTLRKIMP